MQEVLSRCGYRCDLCLAYRLNVESNPTNQQLLSDGWFRYFDLRIPADQIICDGCWTEKGRLLDGECPVRPCVIERGLQNCAQCAEYGCDKLVERLVTFDELAAKQRPGIPAEDRSRFIFPYENKARLDELRKNGK